MPRTPRPRTRTGALARDLGTVLVAVALLSVPRVLADSGLPGAGSATEPPDVSASATAPPDAVPSGPVRPVDDEPLVASRNPFTQLVVPEPPETEGAPAGEESTQDAPDSPEQAPAGMAPVELPEPEEQHAPGEGEAAPGEEQPPSPEEAEAPQDPAPGEGEAPPDGGGVSPSDEQPSSSGEVRSSQPPPPAAAGPESLRLERITVDEAGVARAHLTVAGERYTPAEGEDFGDGYHLAEIDAPCVRVLHGDARERLCEDERVFAK